MKKGMKKTKKWLGILLAVLMTATMLPLTAMADTAPVCKIGEKTYTSITEAINEAGSGATITMIADTTESVTISAGSVTLDLNGFTVTGSSDQVVKIEVDATFTLTDSGTDGKIDGNNKMHGVYNNGTFTMNGGSIKDSKSGNLGGGVRNYGTFTMNGGTISGNTAPKGGGVFNSGTFIVGGTANVSGNKKGSSDANNVFLLDGMTITISSTTALTTGAYIGVNTETAPAKDSPVTITGTITADYSKYFTSDNSDYKVKFNTDHLELAIKEAITPSVTLEGWTYGENANTPVVTGNTGSGDVKYNYKVKDAVDDTYTATVPTDAGTYTVKANIAETDDYLSGSCTADFTIAKAKVTVPTAIEGLVYNGEEQLGVELLTGAPYTLDGQTATNAGEYEATVSLNDKDNYAWIIDGGYDSDDQTIEFSIAKKDITLSWDKDSFVYDGYAHLPKVTASDSKAEIVTDPSDGYIKVGEYSVTASLNPGTDSAKNFNITEGKTFNFTITDPLVILDNEALDEDADLIFKATDNGKKYWYEDSHRQGTEDDPKCVSGDGTKRGREIYDSKTGSWYWLDSNNEGAAAVSKEVWIPYIYQDEDDWKSDAEKLNQIAAESDPTVETFIKEAILTEAGKWVRYNEKGEMMKGWVTIDEESGLASVYPTQIGNKYYYDNKTGAMVKGHVVINGVSYHFDEMTGVLLDE